MKKKVTFQKYLWIALKGFICNLFSNQKTGCLKSDIENTVAQEVNKYKRMTFVGISLSLLKMTKLPSAWSCTNMSYTYHI